MKTLMNTLLGLSLIVMFASISAFAEGGRVGNGKKSDDTAKTTTKDDAAPAATPAPTAATPPKTESK